MMKNEIKLEKENNHSFGTDEDGGAYFVSPPPNVIFNRKPEKKSILEKFEYRNGKWRYKTH